MSNSLEFCSMHYVVLVMLASQDYLAISSRIMKYLAFRGLNRKRANARLLKMIKMLTKYCIIFDAA